MINCSNCQNFEVLRNAMQDKHPVYKELKKNFENQLFSEESIFPKFD